MSKLQQTAEAAIVLNQRKKKKKSKKQSAEGKRMWSHTLDWSGPRKKTLSCETNNLWLYCSTFHRLYFLLNPYFHLFVFLNWRACTQVLLPPLLFCSNRRSTHHEGKAATRGGVCRHLPEIQVLLQSVGRYSTTSLLLEFFVFLCLIFDRFFLLGPFEINHRQSFLRGACSSRI